MPQGKLDHFVHAIRVVHRPHVSILNLPKVRHEERDTAWVRPAAETPTSIHVALTNPRNIPTEVGNLHIRRSVIRWNSDGSLDLFVTFRFTLRHIHYHVEEHLTFRTVESPKIVTLVDTIYARLEGAETNSTSK